MSTWEDALTTFLLRRLDNLTKEDKMQITMISTWAIELYLDKVPAILFSSFNIGLSNCLSRSYSLFV
jgi:vacuolar protein sorting-associated protein 18